MNASNGSSDWSRLSGDAPAFTALNACPGVSFWERRAENPRVLQYQLDPQASVNASHPGHSASDTVFWLVESGSIRYGDAVLSTGDALLGSVASLEDRLYTEQESAVLSAVSTGLSTASTPAQVVSSHTLAWQQFEDPAGRPTQPVQILAEGDLSVLRTRFVPSYSAGEHWHDFDTLYFITHGRMQFGDEGWYDAGDVRWIRGGQSYGPEQPSSAGVEFVLLSLGGPVALHWADLESAPYGRLKV